MLSIISVYKCLTLFKNSDNLLSYSSIHICLRVLYWKAREFHMKKEVCIPGLQADFSLWLFPDCLLHYLFYRLDLATLQTLCDPHTRQSCQLNRTEVSQTSEPFYTVEGAKFIKWSIFIGFLFLTLKATSFCLRLMINYQIIRIVIEEFSEYWEQFTIQIISNIEQITITCVVFTQ